MSRKKPSPHRRRTLAAALVVASLALTAGCGAHGHDDGAQAVAAEAPVADHDMPEHEAPGHDDRPGHSAADRDSGAAAEDATLPGALDFSAQTTEGTAFEGSSVAGKKTVFWFWAPGCMDCAREAPHLLAMQRAYHDDVTFVGVAGLGDVAAMKSSIKQMKIGGFTRLADSDGTIWKHFGIVAQPAYAFVDGAGEVRVMKGALGANKMKTLVAELAEA